MKNKTIKALLEMGMPADIKGFRHITDIMCLYENDEDYITGNLMCVYEKIAEQNNTTASRVERAIRHAFSGILKSGEPKLIKKYLSTPKNKNGSLLATLYYRLKLEE